MSEPTEGSAITPGVKKQTRRFAPVKRGGKTAAALKREATAKATADTSTEAPESANNTLETAPESLPASPSTAASSNKPIGTIRPEGSGSGRLQSVNDGQKTRGGSMKVRLKRTQACKSSSIDLL